MDPSWLAGLGATGAAALVGAAATDVWAVARSGFARLFGRGEADREAVAVRRLDGLAAEVERAPAGQREAVRERLLVAWQARLVDLMEEDPAAAEAVRLLSGELQAKLPAARQQWIQNVTAAAPGATAQGVMFGTIVNHPAPGEPPREREAPS